MPTTPTANISTSNTTQTPSRPPVHDFQAHKVPYPAQALLPSHPTADLTSSHNSAKGPSNHSPPPQDVNTVRPTKRRRNARHANMAAARASSSSDASSQSGMADNETDPERGHHSERSAQQVPAPPKKKRTRTLTTPQQSAVLHALLAKSRFPTTAMREEVGHQIGLSARKVQIWFQNQRQKARRPQTESAPLTRPPQFGPFPIMTPAGPSGSSSYSSPSAEASHSGACSSRSTAHEPSGSLDGNPVLSGPGMPGWSSSRQRGPLSTEEWDAPRRPTSPEIQSGNVRNPFPPRLSDSRGLPPPPGPSPQASHAEPSPHFSRILLPPIHLGALEQRIDSAEPCASPTTLPMFPPQPATSRAPVQRHDPPVRTAIDPGSSPRSLGIPPPFALQPQPQWDPQTFSPYTRPEFASWAHVSSLSSLSSSSSSSSSSVRTGFSTVRPNDHQHQQQHQYQHQHQHQHRSGGGVVANSPRMSSPPRHFYSSVRDPQPGAPSPSSTSPLPLLPLDPHYRRARPASRSRRLSITASASYSRPSVSGRGHATSDDDEPEDDGCS